MAKVFIGIPTYNRPHLVQVAIASVRAQAFEDFRLVVSDNCSDGDTAEIIGRFVAGLGDPRITFHRQPANGGEYGQGRFLFAEAGDDELFMILHDDDALLPDCFAAAVAALDAHAEAAFFVSNAYAMTADGSRSAAQTAEHLSFHGRDGVAEGMFDVLRRHLACGFAPISGVLFRKAALVRSGFVDADCHGNYPFECNVFLRLGEAGSQAWFSPRELMGVRLHPGAMRSSRFMEDPALVATSIHLWGRPRFTGAMERRRRAILARYYRAQAMIAARQGAKRDARAALAQALRANPTSPRAWALAPILFLVPGWLRRPTEARRA